jgi:hypothetical protein
MQVSKKNKELELLNNNIQLNNYIYKTNIKDFDIDYFLNSIIKYKLMIYLSEKVMLDILNKMTFSQGEIIIEYFFATPYYTYNLRFLFDDKFKDYHNKIENIFDELNDCKFTFFHRLQSNFYINYLKKINFNIKPYISYPISREIMESFITEEICKLLLADLNGRMHYMKTIEKFYKKNTNIKIIKEMFINELDSTILILLKDKEYIDDDIYFFAIESECNKCIDFIFEKEISNKLKEKIIKEMYNDKITDYSLLKIIEKFNLITNEILQYSIDKCYIKTVIYLLENKCIINNRMLNNLLKSNIKKNKLILFIKAISEYCKLSYEQMLYCITKEIILDLDNYDLDERFYYLNNIYKIYDIKSIIKQDGNELENLCTTYPDLSKIKKLVIRSKNPIKPTEKSIENLLTFGCSPKVMIFILDNTDKISEKLFSKIYLSLTRICTYKKQDKRLSISRESIYESLINCYKRSVL